MSLTLVLGGTFDPIHIGHVILAQEVLDETDADRILFVPAGVPPHKTGAVITPGRHRLAMVRAAVEGNPRFEVSEIELNRTGPSYTIDTLREIRAGLSDEDRLGLIIGADQVAEFETWKDYRKIAGEFRLVLTTRAGFADPVKEGRPYLRDAMVVSIPSIEVSATEIRSRACQGKHIQYFVMPAVYTYIVKHRLYR